MESQHAECAVILLGPFELDELRLCPGLGRGRLNTALSLVLVLPLILPMPKAEETERAAGFICRC